MLKYLLLLLLWCPVSFLAAQPVSQSWKKRLKAADEMYEQGNYASAAEYYWSAYKAKPTKYELAYKAGECFSIVRDYKNASKAYGAVREFPDELDKVNFYRGLSLKNEGKYQQALAEFEYFINVYQNADRAQVYQEVLNEISGCQMAIEAQKTPSSSYFIDHMGYSVNSSLTEFAPIPVGNNIIYFSSMVDGSAKIYRTQRDINKWTKRSRVKFFRDMELPHYGNGSFTPDGKRFYFTQCQLTDAGKSICLIYVMKKSGENWSKPIKLPDFVNEIGTTNTHPNVSLEGTREVIYFSSDRANGQGGMDIWYVVRNLNAADESYTMPVNLGATVNTPKDEITPFFDAERETLYFSSNGHINIGGYDVFKTKGNKATWATPSNLGMPFNSSADDMYYVLKEDGESGYLVSNRFTRPDKISTLDDDIFSFGVKEEIPLSEIKVNVGGLVVDYEQSESVAINDVKIELFEVNNDDEQSLVESIASPDGRYEFIVGVGKHFRVEASKPGYLNAYFDLMTFEVNESTEIDQNIPLESISEESLPSETVSTPPPAIPEQGPTEAPASYQASSKPASTVLPINPATGQPLPGMEKEFGEPVHKLDLTTYEQYSLIMTSDKNLAYLRKDDLWVPVILGEVTESGVAEEVTETTMTSEEAVAENIVEETTSLPVPPPPVVVKEEIETPPPPPVEPVVEETKPEEVVEVSTPPEVEEIIKEPAPVIPEAEELTEKGPALEEKTTDPVPVEPETFNPLAVIKKEVAAVEYKIQLVAVKEYKDHRYSRIKDLGEMEFEPVDTDKHGLLTRVLITGFPDARTARRALAKAKVRGFDRAFAIRYEKGVRVGVPLR